ncbi:unnamed protein product, partial [Ectocarpus fasciculatus]
KRRSPTSAELPPDVNAFDDPAAWASQVQLPRKHMACSTRPHPPSGWDRHESPRSPHTTRTYTQRNGVVHPQQSRLAQSSHFPVIHSTNHIFFPCRSTWELGLAINILKHFVTVMFITSPENGGGKGMCYLPSVRPEFSSNLSHNSLERVYAFVSTVSFLCCYLLASRPSPRTPIYLCSGHSVHGLSRFTSTGQYYRRIHLPPRVGKALWQKKYARTHTRKKEWCIVPINRNRGVQSLVPRHARNSTFGWWAVLLFSMFRLFFDCKVNGSAMTHPTSVGTSLDTSVVISSQATDHPIAISVRPLLPARSRCFLPDLPPSPMHVAW